MIGSLPALFDPYDPQALVSAMLEKRVLHLPTGQRDAFARLLPWDRFICLPSAARLQRGEMRLVRGGREVPVDTVVSPSRGGKLSPAALQALTQQGTSIVLNGVERHVPAIAALNAMLERWLRCAVWTNCYAGFGGEGAFAPHYDPHDVLVLQLHGSKRWFFHGQPHLDPVKSLPEFAVPPGLPAERELLLTPGDILFLPRGEVHHAEGTGEVTLHLSIGLKHAKGADLLRWMVDQAAAEDALREDIIASAPIDVRAGQAERLAALLRDLADRLDLEALLCDGDQRRDPMQPLNFGLSQAPGDTVWVQPALRRRVRVSPDGPFKAGGFTIALDAAERATLQWLLDRDGSNVADVIAALDPQDNGTTRAAIGSLARKSLVFLSE